MLWDEIKSFLTPDEATAIDILEASGWSIMTETRIEDCKLKDGTRRRTFSASGRYALVLGLKTIDGRTKISRNFLATPTTVAQKNDVSPAVIPDETQISETIKIIGDNFWMDRGQWSRLHSESFFQLVTVDELESLKSAPVDVQEEVKEKFNRICDSNLWPL